MLQELRRYVLLTSVMFVSNLICDTQTDDDDAIFNGILARNPGNLAVTSSLHPFWHTKKGAVVIGLVVLTVIGAIVGGVIGGIKRNERQNLNNIDSTTSLGPACSTSPSQVVSGSVFSTTTDPFDTVWNAPGIFKDNSITNSRAAPTSAVILTGSINHSPFRFPPHNISSYSTTSQASWLILSKASSGSSYW